jgi:outer membrane protein OmpA-like peptidoglycan-associated protein
MKKIVFLLIAACGSVLSFAQAPAINNNTDNAKPGESASKPDIDVLKPKWKADSFLSHLVLDLNFMGGALTQTMKTANTYPNYANNIASLSNTGNLKFSNGMSYGGELQLGYFFGNKAHWGIGLGYSYLYQTGDLILDKYDVQYQSRDGMGNTFRQWVTADGPIKEKLVITNMNIPLVIKYKNRFSKRIGFTADAGIVYNLQVQNAYTTNASFDYQAIYKYAQDQSGNYVPVYDNSATPEVHDWLITKAQISKHTTGEVPDSFSSLRAQGYNVGIGVSPDKKTGTTRYTQGSLGFIVRPAINYFFSDRVALNLGLYYMYQPVTNSTVHGYNLTNKLGEYSSLTNTVSSSVFQSYGLNLGVRFFLHPPKDNDKDGLPNKWDRCPNEPGMWTYKGCPDRDGDGIPDIDDSCVDVPGVAQFHGCPDTDGDGIPDNLDLCPTKPGPAATHGCPDKDGDGIPDNLDLCPDQPGLAIFHGCPDQDGDGIPDKDDKCPTEYGPKSNNGCPLPPQVIEGRGARPDVATPILFDLNQTSIHPASYPILMEAIIELNEDESSTIVIDGYTDNTGSAHYNKGLSNRRADAVKTYLKNNGISLKRLKTVGHGLENPIAPNETPEGRAKNRRVTMTLKHNK